MAAKTDVEDEMGKSVLKASLVGGSSRLTRNHDWNAQRHMVECTESPDTPGSDPLPLARIESLITSALYKISRHLDNPVPSTQATLLETLAHGQVIKRYDHNGHLVVPISEKKRVKRKALAGLSKDVRVIPAHIQGENGRTLELEIEGKYAAMFGSQEGSQGDKENVDIETLEGEALKESREGSVDMDVDMDAERMSSPGAPPTQGFAESVLARNVGGRGKSLWEAGNAKTQPFRGTEDGRSGGSSFGGTKRQSETIHSDNEEEDELGSDTEEVARGQKRRKLDDGHQGGRDGSERVGGFRSALLAGRGGGGRGLWDASAGA